MDGKIVLTIEAEILFCHWLNGEKDWSEKRDPDPGQLRNAVKRIGLAEGKHPKKIKFMVVFR